MYMDRVKVPPVRQPAQNNNAYPNPVANYPDPSSPPALKEEHEQVYQNPVKPQPQPVQYQQAQYQQAQYQQAPQQAQYDAQGPPQPPAPAAYGVPVQGASQPGAPGFHHDQDILSWVLFGVGIFFPILLIVNLCLPCCRYPRWTRGSFIAWLLSAIVLVVELVVVITVAVVVVNNNSCDSYYYYYC